MSDETSMFVINFLRDKTQMSFLRYNKQNYAIAYLY